MNGKRARAVRRLEAQLRAARWANDPAEKRDELKRRIRVVERGGPGWRARAGLA